MAIQLNFRCDEWEKDTWERAAEYEPLSRWIRRTLSDAAIKELLQREAMPGTSAPQEKAPPARDFLSTFKPDFKS